jgi:hypothetical protein
MTDRDKAATLRGVAWAAALDNYKPSCSGYCIGTGSVETFIEDLACPVHGIAAQERAQLIYEDRQKWLEALSER